MKTKNIIITAALVLAGSAACLVAQDAGNQQQPGQGQGGQGMRGQRQPPPIVAALDANHDGTIDAGEIANASAALKKLDKNGDGKLTPDELRPSRSEGGNSRGQDGQGRPPGGEGQDGPPPPQN